MSNRLDPDQDLCFVGPDLGSNCLQRLSTNICETTKGTTSKESVTVNIEKFNTFQSIARILKKIRTSKGDYLIKQWFSSIASLFKTGNIIKNIFILHVRNGNYANVIRGHYSEVEQQSKIDNPKHANILFWKWCLLITSAAYIQVHFRLDLIMEANTVNTDKTVHHCWSSMLTRNHTWHITPCEQKDHAWSYYVWFCQDD